MGSIGDLQFDQRVFLTVFPLDIFPGLRGGAAEKANAIAHVLKNDKTIIIGVNTFFHTSLFCGCTDRSGIGSAPGTVHFTGWQNYLFAPYPPNLTAHVDKLQGHTQVGPVAKLDDRLQIVDFFSRDANEVIHDL